MLSYSFAESSQENLKIIGILTIFFQYYSYTMTYNHSIATYYANYSE